MRLDMAKGKKPTIDIEKVEAALKRAAHRALHGTREERSGRFLHRDKPAAPKAGDAPASGAKKGGKGL